MGALKTAGIGTVDPVTPFFSSYTDKSGRAKATACNKIQHNHTLISIRNFQHVQMYGILVKTLAQNFVEITSFINTDRSISSS